MKFVKVSTKLYIESGEKALSLAADGLHARLLTYAGDQLTDGHISHWALQTVTQGTNAADIDQALKELTEAGIIEHTETGLYLPAYTDLNWTETEIQDRRERNRKAVARHRRKKSSKSSGKSSGVSGSEVSSGPVCAAVGPVIGDEKGCNRLHEKGVIDYRLLHGSDVIALDIDKDKDLDIDKEREKGRNRVSSPRPPVSSESVKYLAAHLAARIEDEGLRKPRILKKDRQALRRLLDDGVTPVEVEAMIDWVWASGSETGRWWKPQTMTVRKLVEHFWTMTAQKRVEDSEVVPLTGFTQRVAEALEATA